MSETLIKGACTQCGGHAEFERDLVGVPLTCPHCNARAPMKPIVAVDGATATTTEAHPGANPPQLPAGTPGKPASAVQQIRANTAYKSGRRGLWWVNFWGVVLCVGGLLLGCGGTALLLITGMATAGATLGASLGVSLLALIGLWVACLPMIALGVVLETASEAGEALIDMADDQIQAGGVR